MKKKLPDYTNPVFVTFDEAVEVELKEYKDLSEDQRKELMKLYDKSTSLPVFAYMNPFGGTYP